MVSAYFMIQSNIICSAQHIIPHQHVDHSIRLSMLRMSSTQSSSITSNSSSASKPEMHRVRLSLSTTQLGHLNHLPNWSPSRRSHPCAVGLKNKCQQGWYQIRVNATFVASIISAIVAECLLHRNNVICALIIYEPAFCDSRDYQNA